MNILSNQRVMDYLHFAYSKYSKNTTGIAYNLYRLRDDAGGFGAHADVSDIINHQIRLAGLVNIPKTSKILHQNIKTNIRAWKFKRAQQEFHVDNLLCHFSLRQKHQGFCFLKSGKFYIYVLGANILSDLASCHTEDAERETAKANAIVNNSSASVTSPELEMKPITQKSMQELAKNIYTKLNIYFSKNTKKK